MLGLGTGIVKGGGRASNLGVITDNLVLKHNYLRGQVRQVSTGAADINADAAANEYIDVGTIEITTNDVSVCAWVYITDWVNYGGIFTNRHASGDNQGFELRCANGAQKFQILIDEATTGSASLSSSVKNSNQWYHVCAVMDRSSTVSLYVDGVADGTPVSITGQADSLTHATVAKIGQNHTTVEMRGYVCNVGYWNRVLTQAEVKSIMWKDYAGLTSSEKTSMVSWWNLDSTIDTATEGSSFVYDKHHGGGETLGSELVTNGTLETDSGWAVTDFTINGTATVTTDGANQMISQVNLWSDNAKDGKLLKLSWDVLENSDSIQLKIGGYAAADIVNGVHNLTSTVGSHYIYLEVDGTGNADTLLLYVNHAAGKTLTIDNVSLKEVQGNTGKLS